MIYPTVRAVYYSGTLKLLDPLKLPEGTTVQVSMQAIPEGNADRIMGFAGSWQDMPEEVFNEFQTESFPASRRIRDR